jgi:putative oxidoreductase
MDVVFLIGRIVFAYLFLGSSVAHLTKSGDMGGYASSRGLPAGRQLTLLTGVQILVGGLSVLLGIWGDLGSLLLVLFLLSTAFLIHGFWKESDPMSKQMEMVQFNKDLALAGASLALFWAFAQDPGLTLTGPLF